MKTQRLVWKNGEWGANTPFLRLNAGLIRPGGVYD
jgi:hypothetical protein